MGAHSPGEEDRSQLEPWSRRSLRACFGVALLFWLSMSSQLPALPLYARSLGGSDRQVGLVMGAFALGLMLFRGPVGRLSDRRGRRLAMQLGLAAAGLMPLAYASTQSLVWLGVFRVGHGLSIAAFATSYSALAADLAPVAIRGEVLGYMSLAQPLGLSLGPAVGDWLRQSFGYPWLFRAAALSALLGGWVSLAIREPARPPVDAAATRLPFWQILASPRVRLPFLLLLEVGLVFGTLSTFLPLRVAAAGVDFSPGWFYTAAAISSFTVRLTIAKWSDRLGRGVFVTIALCFYVLAMLGLSQASQPWHFWACGFTEGVAGGIFIPSTIVILADRTQPAERATVLGWAWVGFDLGIALAGPLAGQLSQAVGLPRVFLGAAGLAAIALVSFLTLSTATVSSSLQFALGLGRDSYALREDPV